MSHETTKGGRTMIGTVPPINTPRPASGTHPRPMNVTGPQQPTIVPPGHGMPPTVPPPEGPPSLSGPTLPLRGVATPPVGTPYPGEEPDIVVGQELGGYVIRRKLAEGGMGVVYEGVHTKIGRLGAIKVLKREFCRSEDVVERFYQEARAVNSIRHDNIVDIYDFGRDAYGRVFFVMEYLEGEPLSARIRRGAMAWPEAFPILEQTLRALKAAHDKGYVHRDLKPDNIWLKYVEGRVQVKLLDFGIAKLVGSESPREKLTQTGSVIGTPHYMSPEQINGSRDVDHRTDIYALGVITYEMFAGVTPFVGDTLQAVMTGHLFREPPRLAELPTHITIAGPMAGLVDRVLGRLLAKDATGRYDSVADVLADLHDVSHNRMPTHADTLERSRPKRPTMAPGLPTSSAAPRKSRKGLTIVGVLAGAAIVAAAVVIAQSHDAPVAPTTPVASATTPVKPPEPKPEPKPESIDYDTLRKTAQTTLRASLREAEPLVRIQGSDALGKVKDQPAAPALIELTERDKDGDVRGHAAGALGAIGATSAAQLLATLETAAEPPLKVWYASALARLGDKTATNRLLGYARSSDLAVSFNAGLMLAELSRPGDKNAIAALKSLVTHEAELAKKAPYVGAMLLTKLAALRDATARKLLYSILENQDEGARLAAAEGLAKIGDDAGKQVLQSVMANPASPNRLVAAVAQIPLGEYGGTEVITASLDAKDPEIRRLAARALGDIAERKSLPQLLKLSGDANWTVRIAAAAAIVAIVGIDPAVLTQASVDWTKSALASQDWAVRKAAAGVLADIPETQAVPLLAQAMIDPEPKVRIAVLKSASKMKGADAAKAVVAAVKDEKDPAVQEQQVATLGSIGNAVAHDTLAQIAEQPGRIGVIAAGSLISVGDPAGKAKLDTAVISPEVGMRLAAVQAASNTNNAIVVPTLKIGLLDKIFDVRFTAAEGLAAQNAEKAAVVPVLKSVDPKNTEMYGRAMAAMTRLGEKLGGAQTPADMLDAADPRQRLAAVSVVRAMQPNEAVPLLRRLIADSDTDVRHAGVDAIEVVVVKDKDQAIRLYRPLVNDVDPFVRSKAAGQLSRLVPPPQPVEVKLASAVTTPVPVVTPPPRATNVDVIKAADEATKASADTKTTRDAFAATATEIATATKAPSRDDAALKHVEELVTSLDEAAGKLEANAVAIEATAATAEKAAGPSPSPDETKLVETTKAMAKDARTAATDARARSTDMAAKANTWLKGETLDPGEILAGAEAAIAAGNYTLASQKLAQAAALYRKAGSPNPVVDYLYGQLYDGMAKRTKDNAAKIKLLKQAEDSLRRFAKTGSGPRVKRANDRLAEIPDDIKELGGP